MQFELYQAECERTALDCSAMLNEAKQVLNGGTRPLSALEQAGVLHALQVLIENAIGKAKHWLKSLSAQVPVSAYDAFAALVRHGVVTAGALSQWNAVIGLRNRIVHDYMNVDVAIVNQLILEDRHQFVVAFLMTPIRPAE